LGAENKSIFSDNLEHDVNLKKPQAKRQESNREKFGDEFHIFLEKSKKISSNIRSKEQALVTLTDRIQKLIQADNKIKSDVEKYKALKNEKDEITDNIKNYVHKYEGKINSIKSTIFGPKATTFMRLLSKRRMELRRYTKVLLRTILVYKRKLTYYAKSFLISNNWKMIGSRR